MARSRKPDAMEPAGEINAIGSPSAGWRSPRPLCIPDGVRLLLETLVSSSRIVADCRRGSPRVRTWGGRHQASGLRREVVVTPAAAPRVTVRGKG
jgi:hypothetical protein